MMNIKLRVLLASIIGGAAISAPLVVPNTAHASTADPTVGDSVVYYFYADTHNAGSSAWYDQDNDMQSYSNTNLPGTSNLGHAYGTKRFTSASTYQLLAASIQTNGYYAGCRIEVNGVVKDVQNASGRYAVATCAA